MQLTNRKELEKLALRLSYNFNDIATLEHALVHRSFLNEKAEQEGVESNERMEFLGDAVLSAAISHLLLNRFPDINEGRLSKFRAKLVNENTLARLATDIELGKHILLGKGEELTGGILPGFKAIFSSYGGSFSYGYIQRLQDRASGADAGVVQDCAKVSACCRNRA